MAYSTHLDILSIGINIINTSAGIKNPQSYQTQSERVKNPHKDLH